MSKLLFDTEEWSIDLIDKTWKEIDKVGKDFGLDYYPCQIEIISAKQMLEAYSSNGLPNLYSHWSFGQQYIEQEKEYDAGKMGLAYEIVINSNPSIAYCMEDNSMTMQTLVMAHAVCGHGSFFKNNYLFREHTQAEWIIPYLNFARSYISDCEERYGIKKVEDFITACHGLSYHGVDIYKKGRSKTKGEEERIKKDREDYLENLNTVEKHYFNHSEIERRFWQEAENIKYSLGEDNYSRHHKNLQKVGDSYYVDDENLLYVVEKYSPKLMNWQREVVRIIRKIRQYFYPQMLTQVMNEGWATFWHYHIMKELHARGKINEASMMQFLISHNNVIFQPSQYMFYGTAVEYIKHNKLNPYHLGFKMFMDLKRICQEPTEEDKKWFPTIAGTDWKKSLTYIMKNFKDESFIRQWLSPKLMRDMNLIYIQYNAPGEDDILPYFKVTGAPQDKSYIYLRNRLADEHNYYRILPRAEARHFRTGASSAMTLAVDLYPGENGEELDLRECVLAEQYLKVLWGEVEINVKGEDDE